MLCFSKPLNVVSRLVICLLLVLVFHWMPMAHLKPSMWLRRTFIFLNVKPSKGRKRTLTKYTLLDLPTYFLSTLPSYVGIQRDRNLETSSPVILINKAGPLGMYLLKNETIS